MFYFCLQNMAAPKLMFESPYPLRAMFSLNRLKFSFISSLSFWAGLISNVDYSLVRILLCILKVLAFFGLISFLFSTPFFCIGLWTLLVYGVYVRAVSLAPIFLLF